MPFPEIGTATWRRAAEHPLATIFVLALAVRVANGALFAGRDAFFAEPDTFGYWALGAALARSDTFASTLIATTDRMPLYPLLLAGVRSTLGDVPRAVALIQAAVDAGTCTLIAALGALISARVGLISGTLAALSPTLIVFSTQILTDTLFLFFLTLLLYAGARFALRPTPAGALLAGLVGGLALATRPAVAALLAAASPLVFIIAVVQRRGSVHAPAKACPGLDPGWAPARRQEHAPRKTVLAPALVAALLFAIGAAAPIAPVLVRNVAHYASISLTSQTGDHLAFWIVPLVTQRANGTPYQQSVERMQARYRERTRPAAQPDPFQRSAILTGLAREELARLPASAIVLSWLEGMVVNLGAPAIIADPRVRALPKPSFYATPGTNLWQKARAYLLDDPGLYQVLLLAGLAATIPFLLLEAVGLVMLARLLPWAAVFAGGVLAYFLLLNGPVANAKYRMPMEPVLIVLAAIPLARFCVGRIS
jgi:Dolichyl-phosphate-mannose-protein mannosyltransferase